MQRREASELKIVVVDYQSCVFSPVNKHDIYYLSPNLIHFITAQKYDWFVGHTFRCYINIDDQREMLLKNVAPTQQADFCKNFPTAEITKHVSELSNTPCLAVSTLDDLATGQVGPGYKYLEEYEMNGVIPATEHVLKDKLYELMAQNNKQLLLIAKDIAAKYPGVKIQLDIIDDKLKHCREALQADKQEGWPEHVKINKVYRYDTNILTNHVTVITEKDTTLTSVLTSPNSPTLFARPVNMPVIVPRRSERLAKKQMGV